MVFEEFVADVFDDNPSFRVDPEELIEVVEFVVPNFVLFGVVVDPNAFDDCFLGGFCVCSVCLSCACDVVTDNEFVVEFDPLIEFLVLVFEYEGETGAFLW